MKHIDDLYFGSGAKIPVFMSSELAECGLACLAMIANYHGHDLDLNSLRQRFHMSLNGTSLKGLMLLADNLGFSTRPVRVELEALGELQLPVIIHWDFNHFVVLKHVNKSGVVIIDPSRGEVFLKLVEFSDHFTGVALEIFPSASFVRLHDKRKFRLAQLFSKIHGHRLAIFYTLFLSLALQLLAIILPLQVQILVDNVIASDNSSILLVVAVGFGGLIVLNSLITCLREWTLVLLSSQFVYQIAGNVFRHLLRLPADFFERRHLGDIMSRVGGIKNIQDAIMHGALSAVVDGSMVVITGAALLWYSPSMALCVFISLFLCAVITIIGFPGIRDRSAKSIALYAREQSYLMESIRGIISIKLLGTEIVREGIWRNLYARVFNSSLSLERLSQVLKAGQDIVLGLQLSIVLYMGTKAVLDGSLSIGMLFSFLALRNIFTERLQILVGRGVQIGTLITYIDRLEDILQHDTEIDESFHGTLGNNFSLVLSNVSFKYGATDPYVLNGVNFEIPDGSFIAIVGPSGGGKTTLLKILLGLQKPVEGDVFLNGVQATPGLWQAWRRHVGVVRQDDQLFSGTIAENISSFDPELNMGGAIQAAISAQLHDEIERLPAKYMTPIGDMGSSLSGGQRQRLLLARALYRKPKILILDEGTANLDPANEEVLVNIIANMEITRILVAHRPALIERARNVVRVEHGSLVNIR